MNLQAMGTTRDVDTQTVAPIAMYDTSERRSAPVFTVRSHGLTDIGHERFYNEDCFRLDDTRKAYVVADGVGGGGYGDLASRIAVDSVHGALSGNVRSFGSPSDRLEDAVHNAHHDLRGVIRKNTALHGMGTTVVALLLEDGAQATIAHVGDSRAYLLRGRSLDLLTQDHTVAAEYVAKGLLSGHEAADHPLSNVLTRALSFHSNLEVDVLTLPVRAGDVFLLCSDGLTKMMSDEEINSCLLEEGGIEEACRRLIHGALRRGGHDNVTVSLIEVLAGGV